MGMDQFGPQPPCQRDSSVSIPCFGDGFNCEPSYSRRTDSHDWPMAMLVRKSTAGLGLLAPASNGLDQNPEPLFRWQVQPGATPARGFGDPAGDLQLHSCE
jgi:hypothetical protein